MPPTLVSTADSQKTWFRSPLMTFHQNFVPCRRATNNMGRVMSTSTIAAAPPLLPIPCQQQPVVSMLDRWKPQSPITRDYAETSVYSNLVAEKEGMPLICRKSYLAQPEKHQMRVSQDHRNCRPGHNYRNDSISSCARNREYDVASSLSCSLPATASSPLATSKTNFIISEECYMNSENCLPRIIKPRKRRKKDRKPSVAMLVNASSTTPTRSVQIPQANAGQELSTDSCSTGVTVAHSKMYHACNNDVQKPLLSSSPPNVILGTRTALCRPNAKSKSMLSPPAGQTPRNTSLISRSLVDILAENEEQSTSTAEDSSVEDGTPAEDTTCVCRCKYCEPESIVWDVSQRCFSPNLMPPVDQPSSSNQSSSSKQCFTTLRRSSSEPTSKPFTNPVVARVRSFSSGSCDKFSQNLLVSSQIVTSHDGHRDIEVKFFSLSASSSYNVPE